MEARRAGQREDDNYCCRFSFTVNVAAQLTTEFPKVSLSVKQRTLF